MDLSCPRRLSAWHSFLITAPSTFSLPENQCVPLHVLYFSLIFTAANPYLTNLSSCFYLKHTSSSSCRAISTALLHLLPPPLSYHSRLVFRAISCIGTELLHVRPIWTSCLCSSIWGGPQEYVTYEFISNSLAVSRSMIWGGGTASRTCSILLAAFLCSCRQALNPPPKKNQLDGKKKTSPYTSLILFTGFAFLGRQKTWWQTSVPATRTDLQPFWILSKQCRLYIYEKKKKKKILKKYIHSIFLNKNPLFIE